MNTELINDCACSEYSKHLDLYFHYYQPILLGQHPVICEICNHVEIRSFTSSFVMSHLLCRGLQVSWCSNVTGIGKLWNIHVGIKIRYHYHYFVCNRQLFGPQVLYRHNIEGSCLPWSTICLHAIGSVVCSLVSY